MNYYQLTIHKSHKMLGTIEISGNAAPELLKLLETIIPAQGDYSIEKSVGVGEKRILESSPHGMKILSKEIIYSRISSETNN